MSDTLIEEKIVVTNNGDHDKMAHYVRKDLLSRSMLEGIEVPAVCGKLWRPEGDWKNFPVCPTCKEIIESLPE